jgi:hypothetical protein
MRKKAKKEADDIKKKLKEIDIENKGLKQKLASLS